MLATSRSASRRAMLSRVVVLSPAGVLREVEGLEHVRQGNGINFLINLRQQSARYRKRERKTHADARTETGVGMHFERAPKRAHAIGDDIEADTTSRDLGDFFSG